MGPDASTIASSQLTHDQPKAIILCTFITSDRRNHQRRSTLEGQIWSAL